MKKKSIKMFLFALVAMSLTMVCTACSSGKSWHEEQLDKGVREAKRIYNGG